MFSLVASGAAGESGVQLWFEGFYSFRLGGMTGSGDSQSVTGAGQTFTDRGVIGYLLRVQGSFRGSVGTQVFSVPSLNGGLQAIDSNRWELRSSLCHLLVVTYKSYSNRRFYITSNLESDVRDIKSEKKKIKIILI